MRNGAIFHRADLHIHSFGVGGSFDVIDTNMTPNNIVDVAIENRLSIISITDHNEITNCNEAINYAQDKEILVIPGIEVSTTQGHLLVYFDKYENLRGFYGKLTITADKQMCNQGIVECLNIASQFNGIGVLAHIELTSGFEATIARFGPSMEEIFKCENLYGLEISRKENINRYTSSDSDANRKKLIGIRRSHLALSDEYELPKLMSSDSHSLDKLGKNAEGNNKLTRIKLDELNFQAFRIALLCHESRIRLEDFIPEYRPMIHGLVIEGGILDGVNIDLSPNLTCIIGSRGAGKSTLLETIREGSGNSSSSQVVDSDVWPQEIKLIYYNEVGDSITFGREKNGKTLNLTNPVDGIEGVVIENYGQGDTATLLQHSDSNPEVLINFLDNFIDIDLLLIEEEEIIEKIRANQSELRGLRLEVSAIEGVRRALNNEKDKLESLKKTDAGELVKYQNALIKERSIRAKLIENLNHLAKTYKDILSDTKIFEQFESLPDDEIVVGVAYFSNVKSIVSAFSDIVSGKSIELTKELSLKIDELKVQLSEWANAEKNIQSQIDIKKQELERLGIPFDLGKINQISQDVVTLSNKLQKLEADQKRITILEGERNSYLIERKAIRKKIYGKRFLLAKKLNINLSNTMDGLVITTSFDEGKYSPAFEQKLKGLMDWRTSQVPKSKLISRQLTPIEFIEICRVKDHKKLMDLVDESGEKFLSEADSLSIIGKVIDNYAYEEFEDLPFEDMPSIVVTKLFEDESGNKQAITKNIAHLSLGQQQSIILSILMLSDSTSPLIIDQPEDNLDSEFIFKTIVKNLRKIKERRQVIIVTHNPNIAVLGDAELIIPLKSTKNKTHIISAGSIDRGETRKISCEILEGGENAFKQRRDIYGIS